RVRARILAAAPDGGTAYLEATAMAITDMLKPVPGQKAIVLMTDGVDLNSQCTVDQVIGLAQAAEVRVYTIGIGEPGRNAPVSTGLVLDHSGRMQGPASAHGKTPE